MGVATASEALASVAVVVASAAVVLASAAVVLASVEWSGAALAARGVAWRSLAKSATTPSYSTSVNGWSPLASKKDVNTWLGVRPAAREDLVLSGVWSSGAADATAGAAAAASCGGHGGGRGSSLGGSLDQSDAGVRYSFILEKSPAGRAYGVSPRAAACFCRYECIALRLSMKVCVRLRGGAAVFSKLRRLYAG